MSDTDKTAFLTVAESCGGGARLSAAQCGELLAQLAAERERVQELLEAGTKIISAIRSGLSQDEIEAMGEFEALQATAQEDK